MRFFRMLVIIGCVHFGLISPTVRTHEEEVTTSEAIETETDPEPGGGEDSDVVTGDRFPRITCDLLSFTTKYGSFNHAACAAYCIAFRKGYIGGYCLNGVCHCRE